MVFVDGRQADPDREARTEHGVPAAVAVLVPRETDQPLDRIDTLQEPFGGHVGEVFAKGITRPMAVAEQVAD